ncbi:MAG TPA: hypothetical protein VD902_04670 [Symbiobacteriaceae bacterium]|nr:hypothetical protein [Symbiobacteriaceae bacterium]
MILTMVAAESPLTAKIRNRVSEGAAVREIAVEELPLWLSVAVGDEAVEAAFVSQAAGVVVLKNGTRVIRKAPRH